MQYQIDPETADMSCKRYQRDKPGMHRNRQSVVNMVKTSVWKKLGKGERKSQRKPSAKSRSFAPCAMAKWESHQEKLGFMAEEYIDRSTFFDTDRATSDESRTCLVPEKKPISYGEQRYTSHTGSIRRRKQQDVHSRSKPKKDEKKSAGYQIKRREKPKIADEEDDDNIPDWIEDLYDNSDRHAVGMGLLQRIFGSGEGRDIDFKEDRDGRPFFTYWVTVCQIIIFIVAIASYGIAPIGLGKTEITDEVLMTSLAIEKVSYLEQTNMWIGLRQDDLIHVGAKYSPCMRVDQNQQAALEYDKQIENQTACCIYNDGSGCIQTLEKDCSKSLATWYKWTPSFKGYQDRLSGSVCGQDPKYCLKPSSSGASIWPDDITAWPQCESSSNITTGGSDSYHMTCEVVGRPCCIGIQGQCIIATKEYCDFRRGYYHQEASLCSQVNCMGEICGMLPFVNPDRPDQFYRLFSSLFMHSGIVDLLINVVFQLLFMRDLEKIIGTCRVLVIYLGSGVAGSLASATFVPYHVEAGPSGSQFGIIAALFTEVIRLESGSMNRLKAAGKMCACLIVLFLIGMVLPQVDNWSHLFGLGFGWLLSIGLRPYKTLCDTPLTKAMKGGLIAVCLILAIGIFIITVILFYVVPVYDCDACMYFSCMPFTTTYCDGMAVNITREGEL